MNNKISEWNEKRAELKIEYQAISDVLDKLNKL